MEASCWGIITWTGKWMMEDVRDAKEHLVQLVLHDLQVELHHVVAAQALKVVRHRRHMDVHLQSTGILWKLLRWHLPQARHAGGH